MEKNQKNTSNPKSDSKSKGRTNMDSNKNVSAKDAHQNPKKNEVENKNQTLKTKP